MKCDNVRVKWHKYLNEECSQEEERELEEHIQNCTECERFIDEKLKEQKPLEPNFHLLELTQKEQQKIVRKAVWKNRMMTAFTVLGIFFIFSVISTMITAVYYASFGHEANKVIQTTTQMRIPNVYSNGGGRTTNIFFNADLQGDLYKELGYERKYIGEYHGKMILNQLNISREWVDGRYDVDLYFLPPQDVKSKARESAEPWKLEQAFNTLNILPEGTVAELAISLDDVYIIDEVTNIFDGYDFEIVWYAIDTGGEKSNYVIGAGEIWGIHKNGVDTLLDSESRAFIGEKSEGALTEEAFKNGLQFLAEHKKLAERVMPYLEEYGTLEEMIDYVNEHGVKTYGVVVTGPTKELLKLKDNEHVQYATIGEVNFWNWYGKPAYSSVY